MMSTRLENSPAHGVRVSKSGPTKAWQTRAWPGLLFLPSEGQWGERSQLRPSTKGWGMSILVPRKPRGPSSPPNHFLSSLLSRGMTP